MRRTFSFAMFVIIWGCPHRQPILFALFRPHRFSIFADQVIHPADFAWVHF